MFLRTLTAKSKDLPHLISPHLGNRLEREGGVRMAPLMQFGASDGKDKLAALPLGGRIKVDPWNDRIEMVKHTPVPLLCAREKLQFEVTPFMLYLTRQGVTEATLNDGEDAPAKSTTPRRPEKQ